MLCIYNLSRFVQPVELNLEGFRGRAPTEAMGGAQFPVVTDALYQLALSPHGFYWLLFKEG